MYGIISGLEPRGYADGDLVQKALQLGVQPFGMSDEEIMQAISEKQRIDDMSGASGYTSEVSADGEGYKMFGKDGLIFDPYNPLDYLLAVPGAGLIAGGIKALNTGNKFRKIKKGADAVSKLNNPTTRGIATGAIAADIALDPDIQDIAKDIFTNDALDDAAEDLEIVNANEEDSGEADKDKPRDDLKGIAAFAEFASQLGTSPGETEEMTGGQFIPIRPFEAPGVMRMTDGGIAQLAKGGRVGALKAGIKGLANRLKPKKKTKTKKKTDKEKETAISKDAPKGPGALDFVDPYTASAIRTAATKASNLASATRRNIKPIAGAATVYGLPAAGVVGLGSALLGGDEETTDPNLGRIADGGGDKDVLDADSSLRDFNYAKALERAQAAGRTEPTFVDYVASFPASYADKLGKDPEFAKQMMAGFVAMMTPTEGIVERSGLADFAGGVMAEQARQEGEIPDQLRLIQEIKENPEILKAMRQLSTATTPADPVADAQAAQAVEDQVLNILYDNKPKKEDKVYDLSGNPIDKNILLQMYRDANGDYSEIIRQVTKK
tara:strand:+ start:589 stop:2244 length:1656 start_codon:yes stop_codon:yes gene_type:complete